MPVTDVNVSSVRTCESDEDPMKSTLSVALQMRSSRNFCVDVTLLVIILGIAAYLYKFVPAFSWMLHPPLHLTHCCELELNFAVLKLD